MERKPTSSLHATVPDRGRRDAMMKYKGYVGKVEFDDEAAIFHGEVLDTRDVITFQGRSVDELKTAFRESIDDYLAFCNGESGDAIPNSGGRVGPRSALALHGQGRRIRSLPASAVMIVPARSSGPCAANTCYPAGPSWTRLDQQRFNALVAHEAPGVEQTGANVLDLQPRIAFENRFHGIAGREHAQDVLDREPSAANNRFAAENLRIERDPFQEFLFVHRISPKGNFRIARAPRNSEGRQPRSL